MSEAIQLEPGMKPNPGYCPEDAIGKRVRVQLRTGEVAKDVEGPYPLGWAADGKTGCKWAKTGSPFDILGYEVLP